MRYGNFDDDRREYVIERPDTPMPWINFLGCRDYFRIISNTGGGYAFYKDARLRRLTRYRFNNAPLDVSGHYLYLRDDQPSADFQAPHFWSPTWQPVRRKLDAYQCRHGLGYTIIQSRLNGIEASVRSFVPLDADLEIWQVTLDNLRPRPARISLYSAVEFCLWDAFDDATNLQRNLSIGEVEVAEGVIYHKSEYRERRNHFAYLACSEPIAGFDTQRLTFLGEYRGWDSPQAVEAGHMSNSLASGWQPIGAQQIRLNLQPGEQTQVVFLLGYGENPPEAKFDPPNSQCLNKRRVSALIGNYLSSQGVEQAFQELRAFWDRQLGKLQVITPDEHTNRMVNIWNAYQVMTTFNLARSASYFETGISRGIGFRDSNQDLLGFMHLDPGRARDRLLELAATQLVNGGVYHQFQPLTKRGNNAIGSGFNDDPLWLVLSTAAYIKESGDWGILDENLPYDDGPASLAEPLFEHLSRSIRYTLKRLGPHRLPLIGRADWNDCLNLNCFSETPGESFQTTAHKEGKVAESLFIAGLFILAAKEMTRLAFERKLNDEAREFSTAVDRMERAIWEAGWDGAWFRRAYDDFGDPLGSSTCEQGQIFVEPQGMCVMAGLGVKDGRAQMALDSVAERLATPHGILLLQPAYESYQLNLGEISSYPPGTKENGSVFCHCNPWIMIAEAMIGRGDRAHDYYLRINPSARQDISEVHRCEPYVYAQMIAGRDSPCYGEAKNSWLTGTAAWNYVAITQWILGIRPTYDGLSLQPAIPSAWDGFRAVRVFRGVRYDIRVERQGPGNLPDITVDGRPINGTLLPLPTPATGQVEVVVRLH
jgi:cellobiose phosphorylase